MAKNEKAAGITNNLGTFRYLILDLYTNTQLLGDSQFDIQIKAFISPPGGEKKMFQTLSKYCE